MQNVLVDLESCVVMFCCLTLSPTRLQGTLPHHYTYSDWLKWIYSPAPDWLKNSGLVKNASHTWTTCIGCTVFKQVKSVPVHRYFILSSIVMNRVNVLPVHRCQGTLVLRYLVPGTVLILIMYAYTQQRRFNITYKHERWAYMLAYSWFIHVFLR